MTQNASVPANLNHELNQLMTTLPFDSHQLPKEWRDACLVALEYATPLTLGIPCPEVKRLVEAFMHVDAKPLTLDQVAILSNNLESRSAKELGMSLQKYCILMSRIAEVGAVWNGIFTALKTQTIERLAKEGHEKAENNLSNHQPVDGDLMKIVKGEA